MVWRKDLLDSYILGTRIFGFNVRTNSMNTDYFDLKQLQSHKGFQKLQALWAHEYVMLMNGLQKAAAKGQEFVVQGTRQIDSWAKRLISSRI